MTVYKENTKALTSINSDGEIISPLPITAGFESNESWYKGLNPWKRLNSHQTYSSIQRHINYRRYRYFIYNTCSVFILEFEFNLQNNKRPFGLHFNCHIST